MSSQTVRGNGVSYRVEVSTDGACVVPGHASPIHVRDEGNGLVLLEVDGSPVRAYVAAAGDTRWVFMNGHVWPLEALPRDASGRTGGGHDEALTAPMPATVLKINVAVGDRVTQGDVLVVLEAMKMELPVRSPRDAAVRAVHCRPGELVPSGVVLVEIE